MKKIVSILCMSVVGFTYAQVDQLTALKNLPEKTEFVKCKIDRTSDGKLVTYPQSTMKVLSYKHNDIGKLGSFYLNDSYISKKAADPGQERPNHPTKPSIFYSTFTGTGSVIIGSLVYTLKRGKMENALNGNFKITSISEVKSEDKKILKSQLKGKSESLTTIDHEKVLKEYFMAMKKIQEGASANLSEADKKEAALAKQVQEEKERKRMGQVSADFNKGKQASPTKVVIKNNSSKAVCIVVADGSTNMAYQIMAGQQDAFSCKSSIYYSASPFSNSSTACSKELGSLISGANSSCNKVIDVQ